MVKLGKLSLDGDLLLAPMMDVTTPAFRGLIRSFGGVSLTITPMVFLNQIAQAPKTIKRQMEHIEQEEPVFIQIAGSGRNEDDIRKTLDVLGSYQINGIDINTGCPARHTNNSGGGADLLKEDNWDRLRFLIEKVMKYTDLPVSVKTRLGYYSPEHHLRIAKIIDGYSPDFITIHGRFAKQMYTGKVDYERIGDIVRACDSPVVGNGDIVDLESYQRMIDTGVNAVMIGRAVMSNPQVFNQIVCREQESHQNTLGDVRGYIRKLDDIISKYSSYYNNDRYRLIEFRRVSIWTIAGIPHYKIARERISKIRSLIDLREFLFGEEIEEIFRGPG